MGLRHRLIQLLPAPQYPAQSFGISRQMKNKGNDNLPLMDAVIQTVRKSLE
jgi:hypothetical protein